MVIECTKPLPLVSCYDALETQTAVSKLKMSVGAKSIIEPDEPGDLRTNEEPWDVVIDIIY